MYITMGHNMWGWPLPAYFDHNHLALTLTQMILALIVMIINRKFFHQRLRLAAPRRAEYGHAGRAGFLGVLWLEPVVFYQMCGMITAGAGNMDLMDLYHSQLYFESAAMILTLITVGKMLEAMSKGKTTNALKSLMKLAPKTAVLPRDGRRGRSRQVGKAVISLWSAPGRAFRWTACRPGRQQRGQ